MSKMVVVGGESGASTKCEESMSGGSACAPY